MSRKGEHQKGRVVLKRMKRRGGHPYGWTTGPETKKEPIRRDNIRCCLCLEIAHYKVSGKGYCLAHYKEACEAQAKINANPNTYFLNYEYAGSPRGAYLALRSIE
jgi:hypothetical protein